MNIKVAYHFEIAIVKTLLLTSNQNHFALAYCYMCLIRKKLRPAFKAMKRFIKLITKPARKIIQQETKGQRYPKPKV